MASTGTSASPAAQALLHLLQDAREALNANDESRLAALCTAVSGCCNSSGLQPGDRRQIRTALAGFSRHVDAAAVNLRMRSHLLQLRATEERRWAP